MVMFDSILPATLSEMIFNDSDDDDFFAPVVYRRRPSVHILSKPTKHIKYLGCKRPRDAVVPINKNKDFQVQLDVKDYSPEDITIKVNKNIVTIEAKHEEKEDEHGFVSRHFVRKFTVPEDFNIENIKSKLDKNGVMTITAPRENTKKEEYTIIPIQRADGEVPTKKSKNVQDVD